MIDGIEALLEAFKDSAPFNVECWRPSVVRTRVNELYKLVCIPKPTNKFILVDKEKGETVESKSIDVLRETTDKDIIVYFVT